MTIFLNLRDLITMDIDCMKQDVLKLPPEEELGEMIIQLNSCRSSLDRKATSITKPEEPVIDDAASSPKRKEN